MVGQRRNFASFIMTSLFAAAHARAHTRCRATSYIKARAVCTLVKEIVARNAVNTAAARHASSHTFRPAARTAVRRRDTHRGTAPVMMETLFGFVSEGMTDATMPCRPTDWSAAHARVVHRHAMAVRRAPDAPAEASWRRRVQQRALYGLMRAWATPDWLSLWSRARRNGMAGRAASR
jgi:hypothetical protein